MSGGVGTTCSPRPRAARDRSALGQTLAPDVPNVKDLHRLAIDREENPIHVWFAAVEKLPHFKREIVRLQGRGGNVPGIWQETQWHRPTQETSEYRSPRRAPTITTQESSSRRSRLAPRFQRERPCFRRISERKSAAGRVRPAFTSS